MNTSNLLKRALGGRAPKKRRNRLRKHSGVMEQLEVRQMLTATMAWDGDALQIDGSDGDDFIAVQQDELGLKVFTEDAFFMELEGRSFDTATSISLFGQGGNDLLFSYDTQIPVTLNGQGGNDFLYSNQAADTLDGGDGFNWLQAGASLSTGENAFGIPGLNFDSETQVVIPQFDDNGRIELSIDAEGDVNVAGTEFDVAGSATVSTDGVAVALTGYVANWEDAFGIDGVDMTDSTLTVSAGSDVNDGDGYRVDVDSTLDVSGTTIGIHGFVEVTDSLTMAEFNGSVANWDDAFGIEGLNLTEAELTASGSVDAANNQTLNVGVMADVQVEGTTVAVSGEVGLSAERTDVALNGSVANWDDAFGIEGFDLKNSVIDVIAHTDNEDDYGLAIGVAGDMQIEDTVIGVLGSVDITPDQIDALFEGSVANWDDAFGIAGLDLVDSSVTVEAYSDRREDYDLKIDLAGKMDIQGTMASVAGTVDLEPGRIEGSLTGSVAANWDDAFGITGLDLQDTSLTVDAVSDQTTGESLDIELAANMDLAGTGVAVTGEVNIDEVGITGSLTGVIAGTWTSAFGIAPLHLKDTTISVSGSKTADGSEMSLGVTAGLELLGTELGINGTVDVTADGVRTNLTGSVEGEWVDAFGIPALNLRDTALSIAADSNEPGIDIGLDTDLNLFGGYIDMIGDLDISPSGVDISFSPPAAIGFTDLLGIPGFTLDDADLTVTGGTEGLEVALASTMDLGIDVDFVGAFEVSRTGIEASLTGQVAEWDNAFAVPGLDLNDVVLTLGAESGAGGASMYIGLGAGMEIGSSQLAVAGLVGFGATGWEVAFRGEVDSLDSDDLIDFANDMNTAANPNAALIAEGSLGDLELRTAFVNFAPYGGNEALGIDDGFGIGGAFYNDGELLGSGVFVVDLANGVFQASLEIPELDLGPVEISDVVVDIQMAPTDAYFRVEGAAELLGAAVELKGEFGEGSFSLEGTAEMQFEGLDASVTFFVDQTGVRFQATAGGAAVNAVKDEVTSGIRTLANAAQVAIDVAQGVVDDAQAEVDKLEAELRTALADAQDEADKVKADIAKAKKVVDSANSSKNYWSRVRSSRYRSWRSAVAATRRAKWWQKPRYKAIEASRYGSYRWAAGRYSAQVAVHATANVAYKAVRDAAGWVLDNAGVEANPNVIRIRALLLVANTGVDVAQVAVDGVRAANAGVLQSLAVVDSLKVNRITISGNLSNYKSAGVSVRMDSEFDGRSYPLSFNASTDGLFDDLGKELLGVIF